jgi:hypothetical protein
MIKLNDPANALKLFKKAIHVADVCFAFFLVIFIENNLKKNI